MFLKKVIKLKKVGLKLGSKELTGSDYMLTLKEEEELLNFKESLVSSVSLI